MSRDEKKILPMLAEAAYALPAEKREYILGYAEGVIAMSRGLAAEQAQDSA